MNTFKSFKTSLLKIKIETIKNHCFSPIVNNDNKTKLFLKYLLIIHFILNTIIINTTY